MKIIKTSFRTTIILLAIAFLRCASMSGVQTAYFIKTDEYLQKGRQTARNFECNASSVVISSEENALLEKAKRFSDSIGVPFFVNILDSTNVIFRWESDPSKYPHDAIQGTVPFSSVMALTVPADLKRITSILQPKQIGDTVLNVVIPSDTSDLDSVEVEKITAIFAFMKSIFEEHRIIRFQSERRLEFTTGERSYNWQPEQLMSCDPKEDFVVLYDQWLIHDYGMHRQVKQNDKKDPYPYETIETQDSLIVKYKTKADEIVEKPCNLRDAHHKLNAIFAENKITITPESEMIEYHFGLGMWMRNNWGLWRGKSRLLPFFEAKGITHPDEMSGYILDTYKEYAILKTQSASSLDSLYRAWQDIECMDK